MKPPVILTRTRGKGIPTACIRCKKQGTAQGYYIAKNPHKNFKVGICRKHRIHGGSRIFWFDELVNS